MRNSNELKNNQRFSDQKQIPNNFEQPKRSSSENKQFMKPPINQKPPQQPSQQQQNQSIDLSQQYYQQYLNQKNQPQNNQQNMQRQYQPSGVSQSPNNIQYEPIMGSSQSQQRSKSPNQNFQQLQAQPQDQMQNQSSTNSPYQQQNQPVQQIMNRSQQSKSPHSSQEKFINQSQQKSPKQISQFNVPPMQLQASQMQNSLQKSQNPNQNFQQYNYAAPQQKSTNQQQFTNQQYIPSNQQSQAPKSPMRDSNSLNQYTQQPKYQEYPQQINSGIQPNQIPINSQRNSLNRSQTPEQPNIFLQNSQYQQWKQVDNEQPQNGNVKINPNAQQTPNQKRNSNQGNQYNQNYPQYPQGSEQYMNPSQQNQQTANYIPQYMNPSQNNQQFNQQIMPGVQQLNPQNNFIDPNGNELVNNNVYQGPPQISNFQQQFIPNEQEQIGGTPLQNSNSKFIQQKMNVNQSQNGNLMPYEQTNSPGPINVLPGDINQTPQGRAFINQQMIEPQKLDVKSFVYNAEQPISSTKLQEPIYGEPDKQMLKTLDQISELGALKDVDKLAELGPQALPLEMLPSFNNDVNDYNQREIEQNTSGKQNYPRLSIIERNKTFNLAEFYNNPKIMLITLSKLYKVDLFKETQLFKQLQELEKQNISLSSNQKKLVAREEHIYNILSQRRMEYLEYMDFLIPYLVLFHRKIKDEVLVQHQKLGQKIYRAVLLRARAEQEQYFLMKHGDENQWNTDQFNEDQKRKIFQDSMFGLIVFPNAQLQQQQPMNLQLNKDVLTQLTSIQNQQILKIRLGEQIFERWCVLYNFSLYIFQSAGAQNIENQIRLPLLLNALENDRNQESFTLKSEDNSLQMEILIDRDLITQDWYLELIRQVAFKQYYFILGRSTGLPDPRLVNFLTGMEIEILDVQMDTQEGDFSDQETFFPPQNQYFKDIVINFQLNFCYLLKFCRSLRILKLTGQRLPEFIMTNIMQQLSQPQTKCRIEVLVLDGNDSDAIFLDALQKFLCSINSEMLWCLSMNNMQLKDEGVQSVSQSLVMRHAMLKNHRSNSGIYSLLPVTKLCMKNVMMSDLGMFNICQALDKIHQYNQKGKVDEIEYPKKLHLDVSQNDLTENSLRHIGGILSKFNGIIYLNLSKSYRMNALYSEYFFDSLIENYSLEVLDLSCIKINEKFFEGIIKFLMNTCTLQAIVISYNEQFDEYLSNYHDKAILRLLRIHQGAQDSSSYIFSEQSNEIY